MQLFPCPFCGPRDETEFHFGGDAGRIRPGPDCTAEDWSTWLHVHDNPKGETAELWRHAPCGQWLVMRRHTVSHDVLGSEPIGAGE
jgi:sarcosine oxidase subunit delta